MKCGEPRPDGVVPVEGAVHHCGEVGFGVRRGDRCDDMVRRLWGVRECCNGGEDRGVVEQCSALLRTTRGPKQNSIESFNIRVRKCGQEVGGKDWCDGCRRQDPIL